MDVKTVYNMIADDFSRTRYKVWKGVQEFLNTLISGSSLIEIGCGNGKNLQYRDDLECFGVDISDEMIEICKKRQINCIIGDMINVPINDNSYDNSMSIAAIHHLDTMENRVQAIKELVRITKQNGMILIYVWCFDQPEEMKRKFTKTDEMVSFKKTDGSVCYRYYHLYIDGELENELSYVKNIEIIKIYKEKGNFVCIIKKL